MYAWTYIINANLVAQSRIFDGNAIVFVLHLKYVSIIFKWKTNISLAKFVFLIEFYGIYFPIGNFSKQDYPLKLQLNERTTF